MGFYQFLSQSSDFWAQAHQLQVQALLKPMWLLLLFAVDLIFHISELSSKGYDQTKKNLV